jgi:hypothetical protein
MISVATRVAGKGGWPVGWGAYLELVREIRFLFDWDGVTRGFGSRGYGMAKVTGNHSLLSLVSVTA